MAKIRYDHLKNFPAVRFGGGLIVPPSFHLEARDCYVEHMEAGARVQRQKMKELLERVAMLGSCMSGGIPYEFPDKVLCPQNALIRGSSPMNAIIERISIIIHIGNFSKPFWFIKHALER